MKHCGKCDKQKAYDEFSKSSRSASGYQSYCKECNRSYLKTFNKEYLPKRREGDGYKTGSLIHHVWLKIKDRCYNPLAPHFKDYGGRGISVSEDWLNWETFYNDIGQYYERGLSVERKDTNGNYCKENCVLIERPKQASNRRTTIYVTTPQGLTVNLTEHCKELDFDAGTARSRYRKYGDDYEKIFSAYKAPIVLSDEHYKFIADRFQNNSQEIIEVFFAEFGMDISAQYIRQIKSNHNRGKRSPLTKFII